MNVYWNLTHALTHSATAGWVLKLKEHQQQNAFKLLNARCPSMKDFSTHPLPSLVSQKTNIFSFPSDLVDYDSEIYANGALESGANPRYQQILQQQQRSPIDGRAQQGYTNNFRQIQQVIT